MRNLISRNGNTLAVMLFIVMASVGIYYGLDALLVDSVISEAAFAKIIYLFAAALFAWIASHVWRNESKLLFAAYLLLCLAFIALLFIQIIGQIFAGIALLCFAASYWRERRG
jgi:hypothetical protein